VGGFNKTPKPQDTLAFPMLSFVPVSQNNQQSSPPQTTSGPTHYSKFLAFSRPPKTTTTINKAHPHRQPQNPLTIPKYNNTTPLAHWTAKANPMTPLPGKGMGEGEPTQVVSNPTTPTPRKCHALSSVQAVSLVIVVCRSPKMNCLDGVVFAEMKIASRIF
jgi:hypothetical protein